MLRKIAILSLIMLVMFITPMANAQLEDVLVLGEPVTDELEAGEFDIWVFTPQEAVTVTITMESEAFDPLLEIYEGMAVLLARDDDSGEGLNAQITEIALAANVEYEIWARSFRDDGVGDYTIEITEVEPTLVQNDDDEPSADNEAVLTVGEPFTGTIAEAGEFDSVTFTPVESASVSVSVTSDDFDTIVQVYEQETLLASDDDSGEAFNSFVDVLEVEAGIDYEIRVLTFADAGSGDYTIEITEVEPTLVQNDDDEPPADNEAVLTVREPFTGTIAEVGEFDSVTFTPVESASVSVSVTSDDFDTIVQVYEQETLLASDDDSGEAFNSFIDVLEVEAGIDYEIRVLTFADAGSGDYTIEIMEVEPTLVQNDDDEPPADNEAVLTVGEPFTGTIAEAGEFGSVTFTPVESASVSVSVTSDDFDTIVQVYEQETLLASDDDSGQALNSFIDALEVEAGIDYEIRVLTFADVGSGDYTLLVSAVEGVDEPQVDDDTQMIAVGTPVESTLADDEQATWIFEPLMDAAVNISLASDDFDPVLEIYDADGNFLGRDDDSAGNLDAILNNVPVEAGASYEILVRSFQDDGSGAYTLSITEGEAVVVAQPTDGALTLGEPVMGSIDVGGFEEWEFTPDRDITVDVSMSSDEFDPLVTVQNGFVRSDDDSGGDFNALVTVSMDAGVTYTIRAGSFADAGAGSYTLLIEESDEVIVEAPVGIVIAFDEPLIGTLTADEEFDSYQITPSFDTLVTITLDSEDFDPILELYIDDVFIASNDDGGPELNSRISSFTMVGGEVYEIRVQRFGLEGAGEYTLLVSTMDVVVANFENTLFYGDEVMGFIEEGLPATYFFDGDSGDIVSIGVTADFDTVLRLFDESGMEVAFDDDGGLDLNPLIANFSVPETQQYRIEVTSFVGDRSGEFTISLQEGEIQVVEGYPPISYGSSVTDFVEAGEFVGYEFFASEGDVVTIRVTSQFDAFVDLIDNDGNLIASDDDSGGELQPLLENVTLDFDGRYVILVSGFGAVDAGEFTLTLDVGGTATPPTTTDLVYGQTVEGTLEQGEALEYTFFGQAGDTITVALDGEFDGLLEIRDGFGDIVTSDDDSGGDRNPLIEDFMLSVDDTYTVVVRSFGGTTGGDFTLTLTADGTTVAIPTGEIGGTIAYGAVVDGEIEPGVDAIFTFEAEAGDTITVTVTADFDGVLELQDADGNLIATDDDSGEGLNPQFTELALEEAGTYVLVYSSFGGQGDGPFTLTLDDGGEIVTTVVETPATPIALGSAVEADLSIEEQRAYSFEGQAGDTISIGAAPADLDAELDLFITVQTPSGGLLIADDDSGWRTNPAVVGVELPEDGMYRVEVSSFTGATEGAFQLAIDSGVVYFAPDGTVAQPLDTRLEVERLNYNFSAGETQLYSFESVEGSEIFIIGTGAVNTAFYAADGRDLTFEDDLFTVPEDGEYLLVLFADTPTSGALEIAFGDDVPAEPFAVDAGDVFPGTTTVGSLQSGERQQWVFTPRLSGEYSFALTTEDAIYDPFLVITDAAGNIIAEDDDGGERFNAQISRLALAGGQPVTIEVRSFADRSGGDFVLVSTLNEIVTPEPLDAGEIALGDSVEATLAAAGQNAEFSLTLEEDATIDVVVDGLGVPFVDVYDADGELVGRGAASITDLDLDAGDYTIVVFDRLSNIGDFTLTVE